MADVAVDVYVGDPHHYSGRVVNVYDDYDDALANAGTDLSTIYAMNLLTGAKGSAISQVAKTTGLLVDQFGMIHFYVAAAADYYLACNDHWGPPRRVNVPS